ncbi:triacylglycerol lipase [Streptomyces sp. V1I6]|uniref:esterase/lipase family protein n=1 Tax=Streptomyces sp. V1I6 TaxID=3042273 RepID=UPI0027D90EBE|nr:alpha/beta fold hydrolase [Streptomyces sp. V1I6]
MRKHMIVAALTALPLALGLGTPAGAVGTSTFNSSSHPNLFVHGHNGSGANWDTMVNRFKNDGWPPAYLDQWNYDSRQANATTAEQLAGAVDRLLAATGASQVDVVTHSMGGLSSRHYLKNLGGDARTEAWVRSADPTTAPTRPMVASTPCVRRCASDRTS